MFKIFIGLIIFSTGTFIGFCIAALLVASKEDEKWEEYINDDERG